MRKGVDVITETVIQRPREDVSSFAASPDNATAWYSNIAVVRWITPPPLAVGSRVEFEARFLGRTLRYVYEIVEHVPNQRMVMRTAQGPFPMETTYTWDDADQGATRMTLRNRGMPSGFSKLSAPLVASMMRKANTKDLARLKGILEGSVRASP